MVSEHACFGGVQRFYSHQSNEIGLPMRFSVYLPPQAREGKVPAVLLLAEIDVPHSTLSGPATKKLKECALLVFGDVRFERLASISVTHLYNI
jgi:S-formylglutathione hydrolase